LFTSPPPTEFYPLSLHDALPIFWLATRFLVDEKMLTDQQRQFHREQCNLTIAFAAALIALGTSLFTAGKCDRQITLLSMKLPSQDRKSTRLNSSHLVISYAVFCL